MDTRKTIDISTKNDCSCKFTDTFFVSKSGSNYIVYVNKVKMFWSNDVRHVESFFLQRKHLFEEKDLEDFLIRLHEL